jgi:glyoxylase-like metal-dependent hydrolase (beta-lactamase superfamily II)
MYEVYAFEYAKFLQRRAGENFIGGDLHNGLMPLSYFVWLIRGGGTNILVDTGFNEAAGNARNRTTNIAPEVALTGFGVRPDEITDVIVTHLHYDHAGNLDKFPKARFHVQDREMCYATGRCMCSHALRHPFDVEPVVQMVRMVYSDRAVFHRGDSELAPGISVHLVGGHSDGLQVVRVQTQRGPVVLASDATHLFANMDREMLFPIVYNAGDMIEGWNTVKRLAGTRDRVVPGHDPLVSDIYPKVPGLSFPCLSLHLVPLAGTDGQS